MKEDLLVCRRAGLWDWQGNREGSVFGGGGQLFVPNHTSRHVLLKKKCIPYTQYNQSLESFMNVIYVLLIYCIQ